MSDTRQISVRISRETLANLAQQAERDRRTISNYVRVLIDDAVQDRNQSHPQASARAA